MGYTGTIITGESNQRYKLVPPDGGWGYFIMASLIIYTLITSAQLDSFGLIYGDFLLQVTGDKAYGIALTNGIFITCQSYTGFLAHILVHLISYRKLGFLGAVIYFVGSLCSIFMNNLFQMIICVSIIQGIGAGLMTNAIYSSFYSYFKKKANVLMGISQTVLIVGVFSTPYVTEKLVRSVGFRNTLWIMTIMAVVLFFTVGVLQPVEWHMREVIEEDVKDNSGRTEESDIEKQSSDQFCSELETTDKLLDPGKSKPNSFESDVDSKAAMHTVLRWCSKFVEISLLNNYVYWSVAIGTSCYFISDLTFLAILPAILGNIGISSTDIAIMMTVHFGLDFAGRVCYSTVNLIYKTRNRYIYYTGAVITVICRIIFNLYNSYKWRVWVLGILGFMRGWMQVTQTLSIAEEFGDKFSSAYSIMFVIGGTLSLIWGSVSGYVERATSNTVYILHLQTLLIIICVTLWTTEFIYRRHQSKKITQ